MTLYRDNSLIVPESLRKKMLNILHLCHLGITKTKLRAMNALYWPGISHDIENFILRCKTCARYSRNNFKQSLESHPVPNLPWVRVEIDLYEINNCNFLILIEYFSKFVEMRKLHATTSNNVINNLKNIFSIHGFPNILFSDGGPQFNCQEFKKFANEWKFDHEMSSS